MRGTAEVDPGIVDRLHANFVGAWRALAGACSVGEVVEIDGATVVASGIPIAFFNPVYVDRSTTDLDTMLERATQFFQNRSLPWVVHALGDDVARGLHAVAPAHHLVEAGVMPGMVLGSGDAAPGAVVEELRIVRVEDGDGVVVFNDVVAAGFGMPREIFEPLDTSEFATIPGTTLYLGFMDEVPVAISLLFLASGIAGIYNVATVAEFRGRGIGAAMTWRAIQDGFQAGCDFAYLQSSAMGYSVYERMGFRTIIDHRMWTLDGE